MRTAASFIKSVAALGHGEVAGNASAALRDPRGAAIDHRSAGVEIDDQPGAEDLRIAAIESDVADKRDQLAIEVVDSKVAIGGLARAFHLDSAAGIEALDLD